MLLLFNASVDKDNPDLANSKYVAGFYKDKGPDLNVQIINYKEKNAFCKQHTKCVLVCCFILSH